MAGAYLTLDRFEANEVDDSRRAQILETVSHLRVTDIRDGMDWVGLHYQGTVSPESGRSGEPRPRASLRPTATSRLRRVVPDMTPDEYTKWAYEFWYGKLYNQSSLREKTGLATSWRSTPARPTLPRSGRWTRWSGRPGASAAW